MREEWDIYDKKRQKTGKTCFRDEKKLNDGEYHIVVNAIILNKRNEILISQRAPHKKNSMLWECCGGSIKKDETSLEGVLREIKEELGIEFNKKEAMFLTTIQRDKNHDIRDFWVFKRNIKESEITKPDGEVIDTKWITIKEFEEMYNKNEFVPCIDLDKNLYNKAIALKYNKNYEYIGKKIKTKIDRALGCKHPKYNYKYPLNYGYIPNTIREDGEELDCYILGVKNPIEEFEGECIAIVNRINDDDDKLIVVPKGFEYTDEEIRNEVNFQEKYFISEIIR